MDDEELFRGLGSSVPSLNLNQLIKHHGLDHWPDGTLPSSSAAGTSQNTDVIHTTSLNFSDESSNDNELAQFPNHNNYSCDVKREVSINVIVEQRMVRFRYDSELSNRNYGKEVLAKIVVDGFQGKVKIRIHAVDDKKLKAHPFCLIGDKCQNGVYVEEHTVTPDNNQCICKATPRIPKQKNYEEELVLRKTAITDVNLFPWINSDMSIDEYWTTNKSMKESKEIILMVEVVCYNQNNEPVSYYNKFSEPINNAKDGKKFEVHAISPTSSSVLGSANDSHFIILTADSYSPHESDVEVKFCDEGVWTSSAVQVKVIKNAIEFNFPGYCDPLSVEKTIWVSVYDKKKKLETSKKPLILRPTDGDIIEHKRKKAFDHFTIPTQIMDSVKTEERSSCSASSGPRKRHHLKKRGGTGTTAAPPDLAKLEEEGMLSLNFSSPMNNGDSSQNSTSCYSQSNSNSSFQDFSNPSMSLNSSIPNTIPAILIPSGSRDMQVPSTIFGTPLPANDIMLQNATGISLNNMAISQTDIPITQPLNSQGIFQLLNEAATGITAGTSDLSQQQTNSIGSSNHAQIQEILKFLAEAGQLQQLCPVPQLNEEVPLYDPHDIRIEDLAEFDQNDVEVDGDVSSSTEIKDSCEKCEEDIDKSEKKKTEKGLATTKILSNGSSEKELKSDNKIKKCSSEKEIQSDNKITKDSESTDKKCEEAVLQSDVVTSNVDNDVEEG